MDNDTKFLHNNNDFIAYKHSKHNEQPTLVFCHGFRSDMEGSKALYLAKLCEEKKINYTRFDCFGHGKSSGDFVDGTISKSLESLLSIIDKVVTGPVILVGSSMGGWLALLAAKARRERVVGIISIACATDFIEELIWENLDKKDKANMLEHGFILSTDGDYKLTKNLVEDGRNHLLLPNNIDLDIPVTLLHGMADEVVPYQTSIRTAEKLTSNLVKVILVKGSDHRMNTDSDQDLLGENIIEMLEQTTL